MFKKSISFLLVSAITMTQVSCRAETKTADSETEALPLVALVVVGWEAIAGYVAIGGAITIGGFTLWTFTKKDAVSTQFERETKEENATISGQYNQYNGSIKSTPNAYVSAMNIEKSAVSKMFESSRKALTQSRMKNYQNGGCVVATVVTQEGGSKGARWEGKEVFHSQFEVIAAQFSATAKAYGKCYRDAMVSNTEFRAAVEEIVPKDGLPETLAEGTYLAAALMQKVGKDLLTACSLPSYALTYNQANCQ